MNRLFILPVMVLLAFGCAPKSSVPEETFEVDTSVQRLDATDDDFQVALREMDHGRHLEAITRLQLALKQGNYPENRVRRELGRAYHGAGMYTRAIDQLRLTLVEDPNDSLAYLLVADSYMQERRPEMAAEFAARGLKMGTPEKPRRARLHYTMGLAQAELGELNDAITHFEAAYKLTPKDRDVNIELAETYERAGQIEKSIAAWQRVLTMVKDDEKQAGIVQRHIMLLERKLPPKEAKK